LAHSLISGQLQISAVLRVAIGSGKSRCRRRHSWMTWGRAMPETLVRAHMALDTAVDAAFGGGPFKSSVDRLSTLLARYAELTADLFTEDKPTKTRKKKT
jgi:hypothetical protein